MVRNTFASILMLGSMATADEPHVLFNGKNFEGWSFDVLDPTVIPEAAWSITDGILICEGRPPGIIRTLKEYSNDELLVEWRWAPDTKPGNSGILIHASKSREMFAWPKSFKIQLPHENTGDFWTIGETLTVSKGQSQERRWLNLRETPNKQLSPWDRI